MPLTKELIKEAVERYRRELDRYTKLAQRVADICRKEIVEGSAIRAQVTFRTKTPRKLEGKLEKLLERHRRANLLWDRLRNRTSSLRSDSKKGQNPSSFVAKVLSKMERNQLHKELSELEAFDSLQKIFDRVGDLAGVRISTYEERSRPIVVEKIKALFDGPAGPVEVDEKDAKKKFASNFYRATHCQVVLKKEELAGDYENLAALSCELQVCSMLAHVWNEIEHDLAYKPTTGDLSQEEKESLEQLGHITKAGDTAIQHLLEATRERLAKRTGKFEDVYDFVARMRGRFPAAENFGEFAGQLFEDLIQLGFDTPEKLEKEFFVGSYKETAGTLLDRLGTWMKSNARDDVDLDPQSSDQLLMLVLEKHLDDILKRHPMGRGKGRPPRIAMIASRFKKMHETPSKKT